MESAFHVEYSIFCQVKLFIEHIFCFTTCLKNKDDLLSELQPWFLNYVGTGFHHFDFPLTLLYFLGLPLLFDQQLIFSGSFYSFLITQTPLWRRPECWGSGLSILELLGASGLLVYVSRLRGAAILIETTIIWCWYNIFQFDRILVPMWAVFKLAVVDAVSL